MRMPPVTRFVIASIAIIGFVFCTTAQVFAGQVVTDDLRQWARQAVESETSLGLEPTANTVAVLYFHNQTGRPEVDPLQKGMALMLVYDLAKLKDLQVVERAQLQALTQELQLGVSGLVDTNTAPRVGRLLGARYLVGGDFNAAQPDLLQVDSNLLQVPHRSLVGKPTSSGRLDALIRMEKEILFEIIRLLRIELTEEQEAELRKPISTDLKALMFLFDGIQSSDLGEHEQAAAHYRNALQLDPDLELAQLAIDELEKLGLIETPSGTDQVLNRLHKQVSVNTGPVPGQATKRHNSEPASVQGPGGSGTTDVRVQW